MADYITASRTKDFYKQKLLQDFPAIISISPRMSVENPGIGSVDAYIEVCLQYGSSSLSQVPASLPAIGLNGQLIAGETVRVEARESPTIEPCQVNIARIRPFRGGFSCGPIDGGAGTYGGAARLGNDFDFILSCAHVLAVDTFNPRHGTVILQQAEGDGGRRREDNVAQLERWVFAGVDCAVALVDDRQNLSREVEGIGIPTRMANATQGESLRKSGRTTGLTHGSVLSDNATTRINYPTQNGGIQAVEFDGQIQHSCLTRPGDSGSLLWRENELTVVGLVFAASNRMDPPTDEGFVHAFANPILRVLESLSRAPIGQVS